MATAIAAERSGAFEEEHDELRESFRRFMEREVAPSYADWREQGLPRELFRQLAEHQFTASSVPEEHGGAGIDDFRFGLAVAEEAMAANAAGLAITLVALDQCVPLLRLAADERSGERLRGLAAGDAVAALAAPGLPLRAREVGGSLVLDGTAPGVINGRSAEVVIAAVNVEPQDELALVVLDGDPEGLARTPSPELVGPKPCERADLVFESVEAPRSAVLDADAAAMLAGRATAERLAVAAIAVAGARFALAETVTYVHDRRAFGRPIAEFENTRFALASVSAEIAAVGAFVDACIRERAAGELSPSRAAAAKLQATELLDRAVDWGVQLHGGYGYMLEYPIAHTFADARFLRLHAGTSEELKAIVAGSIGL